MAKKLYFGFTLIELLITISIIGILSSLTMVTRAKIQKQARDTRRQSDLAQYRNGLESYAANNNSVYPNNTLSGNSINQNGIFAEAGPIITEYLASFIPDPVNSGTGFQYYYAYYGSADSLSYKLVAGLENGGYWIICSNGKSGKVTSVPTQDTNCNL